MKMSCYSELEKYGVNEELKAIYGDLIVAPEQGYQVSLKVEVEKLDADMIKKISLLRRNAFAAPYKKAFEAQKQGLETPLMVVHYRDAEAFFIQAQPDRVTVIFSTEFKEEQDRIIGKVFLQEFVDARRQPSTQNAPQVLYTNRDPPLELRGVAGLKDSENMGYVTFGM
jgi:actin related protein 2/3 complex subunit 2